MDLVLEWESKPIVGGGDKMDKKNWLLADFADAL